MSEFFSLLSDGKGTPYYFNATTREQIRQGKLKDDYGNTYNEADSYTSIAEIHKLNEDNCNKYEYNPLTRDFTTDELNTVDDSAKIKRFCGKLDFDEIVPELIIKPIIDPWKIRKRKKIVPKDLALLKNWASVWDSVEDSVYGSLGDSVGDLVETSVRTSVGNSVRASVEASVEVSVRVSLGDSLVDSVWDSVRAYVSSFFDLPKWKYIKHKKGQNPFQSAIDLWHRGLVPSFDDKIWRLHGPKGKILKEIATSEL